MPVTHDVKEFILTYFSELSGKSKTDELIDRYVSDPNLKQHIKETEAAFPRYALQVHDLIAEGDLVAVRATFNGIQQGPYAGIPATGREVKQEVMVFYRVEEDRISKFWMQMDFQQALNQLTRA